jgi:hypothetical protein
MNPPFLETSNNARVEHEAKVKWKDVDEGKKTQWW